MKTRLFPVIVTAALTSVMTLFAVSHFQHNVPYFDVAHNGKQLPVNYVSYNNGTTPSVAPANFENAAESSVKAVVHVKTTLKSRIIEQSNNDKFSQLFGPQKYLIPEQQGSGSGVILSPDGYIVTNNHVVADADEVVVTFNNRFDTKAKVVASDPSTDIAVLKITTDKVLPFMEFANSDDVKLGQWVLAVGYPLNLDATVTAGIISARGRSLGLTQLGVESYIQTDAAVNPGNSGGALVNTNGQLVGINSAIASPTGSYAGYSYAIPSNIVRKSVNDLIKYGTVQRAVMGVEYVDKSISAAQQAEIGLDKNDGVYVVTVKPNSGAAKAGIQKGDFITRINGESVNSKGEVQEQVARYHPGDNVSITYSRAGKEYNTNVLLTNLNGTTDIMKGEPRVLGATFRQLNDNEKLTYNTSKGVVVTDVGRGALAKQTKMIKGFIIIQANNNPVESANDLMAAVSANKSLQIAGFYPGKQGMYYYTLSNIDGSLGE